MKTGGAVEARVLISTTLELVSHETGVPVRDILRTGRHNPGDRRMSRARNILAYVCRMVLRLKTKDIADYTGQSVSSLMYAYRRVEDWRDDREFDDELTRIERRVAEVRTIFA